MKRIMVTGFTLLLAFPTFAQWTCGQGEIGPQPLRSDPVGEQAHFI